MGTLMSRGLWLRGVLIGGVVGFAVGLAMTLIDYRRNPGGIFQTQVGVHWGHLFETWVSWFVPVALMAFASSLLVLFWRARRSAAK